MMEWMRMRIGERRQREPCLLASQLLLPARTGHQMTHRIHLLQPHGLCTMSEEAVKTAGTTEVLRIGKACGRW